MPYFVILAVVVPIGAIMNVMMSKIENRSIVAILIIIGSMGAVFLGVLGGVKFLPIPEQSIVLNDVEIYDNVVNYDFSNIADLEIHFFDESIRAYSLEDGVASEHEVTLRENGDYQFRHEGIMYTLISMSSKNDAQVYRINQTNMQIAYIDGKVHFIGANSKISEVVKPENNAFFSSNPKQYTKRAYIWSGYLPVVKENPVKGVGLDAYVFAFAQDDYIGKFNAFDRSGTNTLVDKPHSWFIQLAVGSGGFALVSMMMVVMVQYFRKIRSGQEFSRITICLGANFMIASVFNDSIIPTTLIFFVIIGLMEETSSSHS
jgi:hypothetical protein